MKYKESFNRDFNWYMSQRKNFSFDGISDYLDKHGSNIIVHDRNGVDGKKSFYLWDSQGKITPTKHPNVLEALLKTKGSVNLHIKMYAQSKAEGTLFTFMIDELEKEFHAPEWFKLAIIEQSRKYY